jgi:hypothetical protein
MSRSILNIGGKEIWVEGRLLRVAHLDGESYTFPSNVEETLAGLRDSRERIDVFTFLQHPPRREPEYSFPMEWDNLAVLSISTFDNWWNHQIKSGIRTLARRAEKKGVSVSEIPFGDALLHGIVEIHNESSIRRGRRFPHYGMDIEAARKYAGTFLDRSFFIGALLGDKVIGFAKLTVDETGTNACFVNILSMLRHRDTLPNNAMIAQAVRSCSARGISYLVYGPLAYGNKQDGLSKFKEVNGFRRMDLPRYYVPLTTFGSFALSVGLHHRLADYCPEFIMVNYREIRARWYEWKFRASLRA